MASLLGGLQSPKVVLDAVQQAVIQSDVTTLRSLKDEFLAVDGNMEKCVDQVGNSLVHLSVQKTDEVLRFVVEELRGDVNVVNLHLKTPLHTAVKQNFDACCKYLLEHGAHDTVCTHSLSTVFHTAAACGSVKCLEVVLEHAINRGEKAIDKVNETDKNKCTALHKCAYDGDYRVAEWLINNGADVNARDIKETTPIMFATKMGRMDMIQLLVNKGAEVTAVDEKGNNCLHFCASRIAPVVAHVLLETRPFAEDNATPTQAQPPTLTRRKSNVNRTAAANASQNQTQRDTKEEVGGKTQQQPVPQAAAPQQREVLPPVTLEDMLTGKTNAKALLFQRNEDLNTPLHIAAMNVQTEELKEAWLQLLHEFIRVGGNDLMKMTNAAQRQAKEYVPRIWQKVLDEEFFAERDKKAKEAEVEASKKKEAVKLSKEQLLAQKRAEVEEKQRAWKDEEERKLKEAEERHRTEEDARQRREDDLESKRIEELEAVKKKKEKEKAKAKGK